MRLFTAIALAALVAVPACHSPPQPGGTTTAAPTADVLRKVGAAFDLATCTASTAAAVPELVNVFNGGDVPGGIAKLLESNPLGKIMCAINSIATLSGQAGGVASDSGRISDPWAVVRARAEACQALKMRGSPCRPEGEASLYLVQRATYARDVQIPQPLPPPAPPSAPTPSAPPAPVPPGGGM